MSFKIVFALACALLCGVEAQNDVNCDFPGHSPENCDTTAFLQHIACSDDACSCVEGDEDETQCDADDESFDTLDAAHCEDLCTVDENCRFFKHLTVLFSNALNNQFVPILHLYYCTDSNKERMLLDER